MIFMIFLLCNKKQAVNFSCSSVCSVVPAMMGIKGVAHRARLQNVSRENIRQGQGSQIQ